MCDIRPYKNQVYETLKDQHDSNHLFVDPEFPATDKSIYHSGKRLSDVKWFRPTVYKKQLIHFSHLYFFNRQFIKSLSLLSMVSNAVTSIRVKSVLNNSIFFGLQIFYLGNCWFIAGAGAVTLNPDLLQRVVPSDQSFNKENYAGREFSSY